MKKTAMKFCTALPVAAAVLALGGCGGGGDDSVAVAPSSSGSITACYTANSTVNFSYATTSSNGTIFPNRSTTGPVTYNGQAVTGQTVSYPSGATVSTQTDYWDVTSSGVTWIAEIINNGTVVADGTFLPQNMSPGQTATNSSNQVTTFIGFETVSLAGKTFTNTCHISTEDPQGVPGEAWVAPGYGIIKQTESSGTIQYSGDL